MHPLKYIPHKAWNDTFFQLSFFFYFNANIFYLTNVYNKHYLFNETKTPSVVVMDTDKKKLLKRSVMENLKNVKRKLVTFN